MTDAFAPVIVLLGIHGSGKSTLGTALQSLGITFYPEIGTELRAHTPDPVDAPQEDFDRRVLELELARDTTFSTDVARVIESWHLGNFAFALARDADAVTAEYRERVIPALKQFEIAPVRLRIHDEIFVERNREQGLPADASLRFYKRVDTAIDVALQAVGREALVEVWDKWDPLDVAQSIIGRLGGLDPRS